METKTLLIGRQMPNNTPIVAVISFLRVYPPNHYWNEFDTGEVTWKVHSIEFTAPQTSITLNTINLIQEAIKEQQLKVEKITKEEWLADC